MANNSITVTDQPSGLEAQTFSNTVGGQTVHAQAVAQINPNSGYPISTPYGYIRATMEPGCLFFDPFDGSTIDTTRWTATTANSGTVTQTGGALVFNSGVATASALAHIGTNASFVHQGLNFVAMGCGVKLESTITTTNTLRFWGMATVGATPAYGSTGTSSPIYDGYGFEVTGSGTLEAVVYSAGTRTSVATLNKPTDGAWHSYAVVARVDKIFFYAAPVTANVDVSDISAALASYTAPSVQTLPVRFLSINAAASAVANTFQVQAVGVHDTGRNAAGISDGLLPWRKATVSPLNPANPGDTAGALNVRIVPGDRTSYSSTFSVANSPTASAITMILGIWHPSSSAKRVEITKIVVSHLAATGAQVTRISATHITAQGTASTQTPTVFDRGDAASACTANITYTVAPTYASTDIASVYFTSVTSVFGFVLHDASAPGTKPIVLRANQNEGLAVRIVNNSVALTTASAAVTATVYWTEY